MKLDLDIFKITSNNIKPVKGSILIAEPFLKGYYFQRSIVLLTEHGEEGSMGLVLNKPLDLRLNQIMKDIPFENVEVYCGGPVSPDRLFYIHSFKGIKDAIEVKKELYFGGDFDELKTRLSQDAKALNNIRFFIGYSGWSAGQLSDELIENSWIVSGFHHKMLYKSSSENAWADSLISLGGKYSEWAKFPSNPEYN